MPVINILSPHVADLIAAGEVVERPASVIKELVENSIDAGARSITVEIRDGGMSLVRVTDDGGGMSPEDAGIAFLRHATSKLHDERGLESISTLGFRGEALAAISAVSRIELRTRQKGAAAGTRVILTGGDIDEMGPDGCPEGTTMLVRDLFFNTPARLKFMKSDRAEAGACVNTTLRCALGHPEVSLRMIKDGQEEFFSPGDGQIKSCVYSLLGRDAAMNMLSCAGEEDGISVRGYISAPHSCRGNRSMQFFFINGRPFRSATIQAAVEQAYKNTLLTGRFPACVIYISLSFAKVDVNVHPTKSEVKFTEEKKVFDAVYYAALAALGARQVPGTGNTAEIKLSPSTEKLVKPNSEFFKSMTADQFRQSGMASKPQKPAYAPVEQVRIDLSAPTKAVSLHQDSPAYQQSHTVFVPAVSADKSDSSQKAELPPFAEARNVSAQPDPENSREDLYTAPAEKPQEALCTATENQEFKVIGEALGTYIIAERGEELILIDKHAAHERIIFDRLTSGRQEIMSQGLLIPVTYNCGAGDMELLEENSELLEKAGFEIDAFGGNSVIIRSVPADTDGNESAMLEEILEHLRRGSAGSRLEEILHTVACKAAIKAGKSTDTRELRVLAERVLSGEVRYCPHGRPISVVLTKKELDRQFKRIV